MVGGVIRGRSRICRGILFDCISRGTRRRWRKFDFSDCAWGRFDRNYHWLDSGFEGSGFDRSCSGLASGWFRRFLIGRCDGGLTGGSLAGGRCRSLLIGGCCRGLAAGGYCGGLAAGGCCRGLAGGGCCGGGLAGGRYRCCR